MLYTPVLPRRRRAQPVQQRRKQLQVITTLRQKKEWLRVCSHYKNSHKNPLFEYSVAHVHHKQLNLPKHATFQKQFISLPATALKFCSFMSTINSCVGESIYLSTLPFRAVYQYLVHIFHCPTYKETFFYLCMCIVECYCDSFVYYVYHIFL